LLKWMNTDIIKEEMDTLVANNLEFKEVVKYVADSTKMRFFERILWTRLLSVFDN